ncbi:uncharacterized protein LOC144139007 [Haemaphysalis longicornis]
MTFPYRTKKAMWQKMAELISAEFSTEITTLQVQNKWKSLERSYKKAKANNGSSGAARVCEYEDELSDVLEKEHHIRPTVVLRPGATIEKTSSQPQEDSDDENSSCCEELPARPASAAALGEGRNTPQKKRKRSNGSTVEAMLLEFREAKKERADRFEKKLSLLDRLVTAVEEVAAGYDQ